MRHQLGVIQGDSGHDAVVDVRKSSMVKGSGIEGTGTGDRLENLVQIRGVG